MPTRTREHIVGEVTSIERSGLFTKLNFKNGENFRAFLELEDDFELERYSSILVGKIVDCKWEQDYVENEGVMMDIYTMNAEGWHYRSTSGDQG